MLESFSVGEVFAETFRILKANAFEALAFVLCASVFDFWLEYTFGEWSSTAISIGVNVLLVALLEVRAMGREGLLDGRLGLATFTGMVLTLFLVNLGVLAGLIALIIPGLLLAVRWTLAPVLSLAERLRPGEAMVQSWRLTRACQAKILVFYILTGGVFLAAIIGLMVFAVYDGVRNGGSSAFLEAGSSGSLVSALCGNAYSIFSCYSAVAIYILIVGSPQGYEDVFG